jgi:hypothetical protein
MSDILVLCPGRAGRRIVEDQLSTVAAEVAYLNVRSELRSSVAGTGARAIVSDLFDGDGRPTAAFLRNLNQEFPELKIVLSYDPSPAALDDVFDAAMSEVRFAFAARPFNHLGYLLEPLLAAGSTRPASGAAGLVTQVVPQVDTAPARRCLTLASVNPAHRVTLRQLARFCDATERTLYRHLEALAPPKLLLSGLAWPQANYFLTSLHWNPRQVAAYFDYPRPALLIDLLGAYVESGLWRLGLDASVDGIAAATAESSVSDSEWLHHRRFRISEGRDAAAAAADPTIAEQTPVSGVRPKQIGDRVVSLLGSGLSPIEIVRRLWRRHDLDLPYLYRGVMQVVQTVRSRGIVEEIRA